ncbi:MAG TPA: hypothetical protein VHY09_04705 [Candidatus Methylacidiphilales bacterium]|nr:hypothetical protein [Candidatus Methylacidiphilales bacterium]
MRIFRVVPALVVLICCLFLVSSAGLASASAKKPAPPPDYRKLVKSVDPKNNSITILNSRNKEVHTYRIDDLTQVQIDGVSAKFAAIKAGMEVSDITERDADDLDAVSLLSRTHAPTVADAKPVTVTGDDKTIQSVLADKGEVVIFYKASQIEHTYRIDANTQLKVNGVPGTIADIKPGMEVKDYMERDNDDLDGLTLMGFGEEPATPTTAAKSKPPAKPKPKPAASASTTTSDSSSSQ